MRYLCLIYHDERVTDALTKSEHDAIVGEVLEYREVLRQRGHYVVSSALHFVRDATTIRVRNGELLVTDGPFAETREQLGGFYLVDARDLTEDIRLAARMPPARLGCIEVRPLRELTVE